MEDVIIIITLMMVGVGAGFLAGLFGIGGGTILVPVFLTVFPLIGLKHPLMMHIAVSTSLALIIPTAISSTLSHYKLGHLSRPILNKWLPGLVLGTLAAATVIHYIPTFVLKVIFTVYLLLCFIFTLTKSEQSKNNEDGPSTWACRISSFFVGGASTLLGTGGGTFIVPIFVYFDYPLKKAIGVSAISGFFIGVIGTIVVILGSYHVPDLPKYSLGYVNLLACLAVGPTAMLTTPWGARLEERLSKHALKVSYTLLLLIAFLVMLYNLI